MWSRRTGACVLAALVAASAGQALAWDDDAPLSAEAVMGGEEALAAAQAPASAPAPAGPPPEMYAGLFGGRLEADPSVITASYQCLLCAPVTASGTLDFSDGPVAGLRAGLWGRERWRILGVALEVSRSQVSADDAKAEYMAVGLTPLLRWPLLPEAGARSLQVAPYAGLLLAGISGGQVEVRLPAWPAPLSGTPKGRASGMLAGLSVGLGRLQLMLEYRDVNAALSVESFAAAPFDLDIDSRQSLVGLYYRH